MHASPTARKSAFLFSSSFFNKCFVPLGFLTWKIRVASPPGPTLYQLGYIPFSVFPIHPALTVNPVLFSYKMTGDMNN